MRILLTGGTGFLGRHIVWRMAARGDSVIFTGRNESNAKQVLAADRATAAASRFIRVEHGTPHGLRMLCHAAQGMDAVIHCAALPAPWGAAHAFEMSNVQATADVVAACEAAQVPRLVHISTPSLTFAYRDQLNIRECDPLPPPVNHYARTKAAAERIVANGRIDSVVTLRPRAIFGPWDSTLLPRLLRVAERGTLPLFRNGEARIDLTYVDNVVDAVLAALSVGIPRGTFHITNDEPMIIKDLFLELASQFALQVRLRRVPYRLADTTARFAQGLAWLTPGWEPPITRYSIGLLAFSQTLDIQQAKDILGYKPSVSLSEGLSRTADWYKRASQPR